MNRRKFLQLAMGAVGAVVVGRGAEPGKPQEPLTFRSAEVFGPVGEGIHDIYITLEDVYYPSRHAHSYDKAAWLDAPDSQYQYISTGKHTHSLAKKGA